MLGRPVLLIGCLGLLVAPTQVDAGGRDANICHRTGAPARTPGVFQGQIIKVSPTSISMHVSGHGDAAIPPALMARFVSSKSCHVNAAGTLVDAGGQPIQPVQTTPGAGSGSGSGDWDNSGADEGDPG